MKTQDLYLILLLYSENFRWVFNMPSYITNGLNHMLLSRCQWFTCTLIPDANPPHIVFFNCDICIGHVGQNKFAAGTEQSWKMLSWLLNTVAIRMHVKCMLYSGLSLENNGSVNKAVSCLSSKRTVRWLYSSNLWSLFLGSWYGNFQKNLQENEEWTLKTKIMGGDASTSLDTKPY